jgi:predicted membrane protein
MVNLFQFSDDIHYADILNIIAILCLVVSFLAYYLIFYAKDAKMGNYKYYLIDITTWNFIVCITGTVILRKTNVHDVPNVPVIAGLIKFFNSQKVAHMVGLIEHIGTVQIGISIAVCCFFKFLHLAVLIKNDREVTLKKLLCVTIVCHVISILAIGK